MTLEEMDTLLSNDELLSSSRSIRKAFNTYTANLRFGENYTLNLTGKERKDMIRSDALPDIKTVITADLDLRDLQRNQILTLVEDLRAEVKYQLKQAESKEPIVVYDRTEADSLLKQLCDTLDTWFGYIGDMDVKAAKDLYLSRLQKDQ